MASQDIDKHIASGREVAIEVLGQLAEFWGFTRTMGRIFGLVYLAPKPISQADIGEQLSISPGSVSLSINGLLRWGAVRKARVPGSRKLLYESETDFRKIVTSVLESRERQTLEEAADAVAHALDKIKRDKDQGDDFDEKTLFVLERLNHLESVYRLSFQLLNLLLNTGRIDVESVAENLGHTKMIENKDWKVVIKAMISTS